MSDQPEDEVMGPMAHESTVSCSCVKANSLLGWRKRSGEMKRGSSVSVLAGAF